MPLLKVKNISKAFLSDGKKTPILKSIDLSLEKEKILCILGPSGCGKTTLLKIIAGLENQDSGRIIFDNEDISNKLAYLRRFGMMFQDFALFPHKNVFENISFGLEMQKKGQNYIKTHVEKMLDITGLKNFAFRMPDDLSGGERQRVALARSLACNPKLLLLDEPMGALDRALRERLMLDIRRIIKNFNLTAIFVTHDQAEAFSVADLIAVMHDAKIVQIDSPKNIYEKPINSFTAKFLGFNNILDANITKNGLIKTKIGEFNTNFSRSYAGMNVKILIKDDALIIDNKENKNIYKISGRVLEKLFKGMFYQVILKTYEEIELSFSFQSNIKTPDAGENISLYIDLEKIIILTT
jgi:ABC-type Fe3+/spermidine/putrescine transport system ATPase subunit